MSESYAKLGSLSSLFFASPTLDKATITVKNVNLQERLIILKDPMSDEPFTATYFVRCCNFHRPTKGIQTPCFE